MVILISLIKGGVKLSGLLQTRRLIIWMCLYVQLNRADINDDIMSQKINRLACVERIRQVTQNTL